MGWYLADLSSTAKQKHVATIAESIMANANDVHLRHNVNWALHEQESTHAVSTYLLDDEKGNQGVAVILKRQRPIKFQVGEITLFSAPLVRYDLWRYPIISAANDDKNHWTQQAADFFECLSSDLYNSDGIGIEGVPQCGQFMDFLTNNSMIQDNYLILRMSSPFKHQYIKMPCSYEKYLENLGKRSRKSLDYSTRRLQREYNVALRSFENTSDLNEFLDDAISVSRRTYQWNLLGLGLRDREDLYRRLYFAATQGWFRSYLLYCDNVPVAFMLGYQYQDCYYYLDVGYDVDWSKWSVGSVLQLEVLRDLYEREDCPKLFDFSTGYGDHKARFGNHEEEEINLLLLTRTLKNRLLFGGYIALDYCSSALIGFLDRLGVKQRIKKAYRLFSVKRASSVGQK